MTDTPETDALRDEIWDTPYRDGDDFSKMLDHAKKLESERDEARSRFNDIDLCQNGQAPCKWSLKLIDERDEAREQRDALVKALEECKEDSIELLGERDWWKDEPRSGYSKRYKEIQNNIARADAVLAAVKTTNQND